ncbi:MAG TPA: hypothetical protein VFA43_11850 [Gemmatimonadaceae bacterium]|nr:hypothetical protein [Gemmatimonadaceae bacterium]
MLAILVPGVGAIHALAIRKVSRRIDQDHRDAATMVLEQSDLTADQKAIIGKAFRC